MSLVWLFCTQWLRVIWFEKRDAGTIIWHQFKVVDTAGYLLDSLREEQLHSKHHLYSFETLSHTCNIVEPLNHMSSEHTHLVINSVWDTWLKATKCQWSNRNTSTTFSYCVPMRLTSTWIGGIVGNHTIKQPQLHTINDIMRQVMF